HLRQPTPRRERGARGRRRDPDREVPDDLPGRPRMSATAPSREKLLTIGAVCRRLQREFPDISISKIRYLEDRGLLTPRRTQGGERWYGESDADIAAACARLERYGIAPRHLRTFRTGADREAGLLEALVAPALRSRNPERRRAAVEDLQQLGESAQELSQLLFRRHLRRLAGR